MTNKTKINNDEILRERALAVLLKNQKKIEYKGSTYIYTVPSIKTYPFQWFWDSCFHAIVYTVLGKIDLAKEELKSLLTAQRKNGFIPHIIFWEQNKVKRWPWHYHQLESAGKFGFIPFISKPHTTELIQPPLLAQVVERIFLVDKDKEWLEEVLPKINLYYRYLLTFRDPDKDGLISIIAPFESGLDFSPAYDKALGFEKKCHILSLVIKSRWITFKNKWLFNQDIKKILSAGYFDVEDVLVNSILALNLLVLADLNEKMGVSGTIWRKAANFTTNSILKKCYHKEKGAFFNIFGKNETLSTILTIHSLMPLIIPSIPPKIAQSIISHLKNPNEFLSPYPIATVAMTESCFVAKTPIILKQDIIWRGSTWINTNWYLIHALRRFNENEVADYIANKSKELVLRHGFREYFNPLNGDPGGAEDFGWSTLVVDM